MSLLFKSFASAQDDGKVIRENEVAQYKKDYWIVKVPSAHTESGWQYIAYTYKPTLSNGAKFVNDTAAKDDATWDLESELERMIGGNATVGICGNAISVDKTTSFAAARNKVADFARKHGASVVNAQEKTDGFAFKLSKALDAAEVRVGGKVMITQGSFAGQNGVVTTANGGIFKVKLSSGGEYGFRAEQIRAYDEAEAAKDAACDATEIQRVEKLLGRELTDAEFWKLGEYCTKNMKVGKSFTDAELLKAVKDSAAAQDSCEWNTWMNSIGKTLDDLQKAKKAATDMLKFLEKDGDTKSANFYRNEIIPFLKQAESKFIAWS